MIDERIEEAASLYALDLLEGEEKASFEARLKNDASLRTFVDELRVSSTALALLVPPASPSAGLRNRVLSSLPSDNARTSATPAPVASVIPFRAGLWAGWAAAACFAVGAAYLGQRYVQAESELTVLREKEALARLDSENARQLLEAERLLAQSQVSQLRNASDQIASLQRQADVAQLKISSLASLLTNSPEAQAIAVWNPEAQEGVLTVANLPALPSDRDYQLWVIDPQYPIPVDGGVFTVEPASGEAHLHFKPKEPIKQIAKFAVSLERKGGVPKAEGPMVLISP
jgi:anti-sigma-K factor RskA